MKQKRASLPLKRRHTAEENCFSNLSKHLLKEGLILSFASKADEIDLWPTNQILAKRKQLLLPKVESNHLRIFHVESFEQLQKSSWSILEPNPALCPEIEPEEIATVLVPGLAFDSFYHRIGYGKGYYDRLLTRFPASCVTIGIGFTEQYVPTPLPTTATDIPLKQLLLF